MEENLNTIKTLEKYIDEYNKDVSYNRLDIEDVQLKLPAIKAKWIARLINGKKELNKLYDIQVEALEKITETVKNESLVAITTQVAEKTAEKHDLIKKIKKEIKAQQLLIEFLEKSEKSIHTVTYDIKNSIDLIKSEES